MKKCNLSLLIFLLLSLQATAQGWERVYPYNPPAGAASYLVDLHPTADGGYLLAGEADWFTGAIRHYLRLIKVDGDGNAQWDRAYSEGDVVNNRTAGVLPMPDGGYAVGITLENGLVATNGIFRVDAFGDSLWTTADQGDGFANDLIFASDGGFLLGGNSYTDFSPILPKVFKFDSMGQFEWSEEYPGFQNGAIFDLAPVSTGGYIGVGEGSGQVLLLRIAEDGELLWSQLWPVASGARAYAVVESPDGGFYVGGSGDGFAGPAPYLWKTDEQGELEWTTVLTESQGIGAVTDLALAPEGGVAATGSISGSFQSVFTTGFLSSVNADGTIAWERSFADLGGNAGGGALLTHPDGGYLVAGSQSQQAWLMKTDALGNAVSNWVQGSIWRSTTCDTDDVISNMPGWTVRLRGDNDTLYTTTDTLGNYAFQLDTGSYHLQVLPPNALWAACDGEVPLQLTEFYDTTYQNLQVAATAFCPLLTTDVSTPFMRRCFDNTFTVQYCNQGTETAFDAYVEIELDSFLELTAANLPFTDLGGNVYSFDLGNLEVGDCGYFQFTAYLDCENVAFGQTHCVSAHIFPDTNCLATANQAVIDLEPGCEPDSVSFLLRNEGDASMLMEAPFIVIEDDVMYMMQPFELGIGEERTVKVPAGGATWRLEAPRRPDDPATGLITATVEGCDADGDGNFSTGFVNQFTLFTGSPSEDIECQPNIGSYDPNDKRAFPVGYDEDHLIEPGTPLEYHIRFQNTGTDTAFRVEIVDTLSQWLDPATLRPGASSHPYTWQLDAAGALRFRFDPIALPDSNVNEPASHGFVKFYIESRPDVPEGTRIENRAAIYFDFNAPVITNTFFHTIGADFLRTVSVRPEPGSATTLRVFPNPFVNEATLEVEGLDLTTGTLQLFDAQGRLVCRLPVNGNRTRITADHLPKGLYVYRLESEGRLIGAGRLVVQ